MQTQSKAENRVSLLGGVRRRFLGLSVAEASFAKRGFIASDEESRQRLEQIGVTFLTGYHAALEETSFNSLANRLTSVETDLQGFAFEGTAMGLALLDCLTPWRKDRWRTFTECIGKPHIYMMHVGLGWALARFRRSVTPHLARLDPLLGWLAIDGYGQYKTWMGKDQQPGPSRSEDGNNWANFIEAVRSRKQSDLNAPIEEGFRSTVLVHLANISYRLGRTLEFDAENLKCKGDPEATAMFTRQYRAPFVVPEKV